MEIYSTGDEDREQLLDFHGQGPFQVQDNPKLKLAHEKFWSKLLKSCNQLQEEQLKPLAIWHCPIPGLIGVIQMVKLKFI